MHQNLLRVEFSFIQRLLFSQKLLERGTTAKRLESHRVQQGDYLSNGTQIQIVVKLARSLVRPIEHRIVDNRQLSSSLVRTCQNQILFYFFSFCYF